MRHPERKRERKSERKRERKGKSVLKQTPMRQKQQTLAHPTAWATAATLALVIALSACASRGEGESADAENTSTARERRDAARGIERAEYPVPRSQRADPNDPFSRDTRGLFGRRGFTIGGAREDQEETGIGVSVYLWRASLDSLQHLPLRNADPFGGLIQTEWFEPDTTPGERVRVDLRITSRVLVANGVSASVFKQTLQEGNWRDARVADDTAYELENAILRRAREIRFAEETQ